MTKDLNGSWRQGVKTCKMLFTYPVGNITLSNKTLACIGLQNTNPRWIGIVRDQYNGADHGNISNIFFHAKHLLIILVNIEMICSGIFMPPRSEIGGHIVFVLSVILSSSLKL